VAAGGADINRAVAKTDRAGRSRLAPWRSARGRLLLLVLGLAGAGVAAAFIGGGQVGGGHQAEKPRVVTGAPKQVTDTLLAFKRALADGDFATICSNLFTIEAREAAGGDRCASVLQDSAGGLRDPRVTIVSVTIRGDTATAVVRAQVAGGPPMTDDIRLARQQGRFRIVSLGPPAGDG
jgi:hypothetical protein